MKKPRTLVIEKGRWKPALKGWQSADIGFTALCVDAVRREPG